MESMHLKKAIINSNEIILLRKKGDIIISIDNITRIDYTKPTFFSCLIAGLLPDGTFPGYLKIFLKEKINKSKDYLVKIKHNDVLKLPEFYLRKIDPSNNWGWRK